MPSIDELQEARLVTRAQAIAITGGLGNPSKMPGKAYGLPARECHIGAQLRHVANSTCESCYALKGNYVFRNVQLGEYRRLRSLSHPQWIDAMVRLIEGERWFRWHDSGDLQSVMHLRNIVLVCNRTPKTHHWLPTREYRMVQQYLEMWGAFPSNLTVRLSAHIIDRPTPGFAGLSTSMVHSSESAEPIGAKVCRAYTRDNHCGNCRACWSSKVKTVSYLRH